jgi:Flp pilus assembly protein TadG
MGDVYMIRIKQKKPERGAALVELTIVLPFMLILLMGIIELGLLFYNQQVLTNSSREGARSGIARLDVNGDGTFDESDIFAVVDNYWNDRLITFGPAPVVNKVATGEEGLYGVNLTVRVDCDYTFLVPGLLGFNPVKNLVAQTVMRMEGVIPP